MVRLFLFVGLMLLISLPARAADAPAGRWRVSFPVETRNGVVTLNLDGPMSLFSATQKYGLQLALFLPTLLR